MNEVASLGALPGFHSEINSFRWTRDSERSLLMNCLQKEALNTMCYTDLQTAAAM